MDPVLKAALSSWDWRLDVIITLLTAGVLFSRGWWRLRQRTRNRPNRHALGARWRPVSYWLGLVFVGLALMSPLDTLASTLFSIHMVQHLFLIMFAPPLLLATNPMPFVLWGLPDSVRLTVGRGIARLLNKKAPFRHYLRSATSPGIIWLFWFISIIGWHDPGAYNAALRSSLVHDLEHLSFFLAGVLFWWHVTGAGPRVHKQFSLVGRIAFVISAIPPNMLTGIVIAFINEPIYTYYLDVPRLWGLSVMDDQRLAGVIMWVPGSMMYIIIALIMVAQLLQGEQEKPVRLVSQMGNEQDPIQSGSN